MNGWMEALTISPSLFLKSMGLISLSSFESANRVVKVKKV